MGDLAAGSAGWIDWNVLLDARGGPNHLNNTCDVPLVRLDSTRMGSVSTVALWLFHNFPSSAIVIAGLTQANTEAFARAYVETQ